MIGVKQFKAMAEAMQGEGSPLEALAAFVSFQPEHVQVPVQELADFANGAPLFGPGSPPAWARQLFQDVAPAFDLSPELLAAVAWTGSGFDPSADGGLMGLSPLRAGQDGLTASLGDLVDGDRAAVNAVRLNVEVGARELTRAIRETGGDRATGLRLFLQRQGDPDPDPFEVVAAFTLYLARRLPREKMEGLNQRFQELAE